jgi:hypothetical protein
VVKEATSVVYFDQLQDAFTATHPEAGQNTQQTRHVKQG